MQIWKPVASFDVRSAPDFNAKTNKIAERDDNYTRLLTIGPSTDGPDGPWIKIRVYPPLGQASFEGWARVAWLEIIPVTGVIDLGLFTAACVDSSIGKTSAHYLIALADMESSIRNVNSSGSSAFGPFQFLQTTWNDYVHANMTAGLTEIDILDPMRQPIVAAELAWTGAAVIGRAINRKPTYGELFFAHIFGRSGGAEILKQSPTTPIRRALAEVYPDSGRVEQIIEKNKSLLRVNGAERTVREVLDEVGRRLDVGFARAEKLIGELLQADPTRPSVADLKPPAPIQLGGGDVGVPWMARAKAELGVKERAGSRSNPRIESYFRATTIGSQTDDVAWCGAFVSWCLANSGDPNAESQNLHSATAVAWANFGQEDPNPAYGTIAVLRPLVEKSTGHVGFVTKIDAVHVTLLAGNQSNPDQVSEKVFKKSSVRPRGFRRPR